MGMVVSSYLWASDNQRWKLNKDPPKSGAMPSYEQLYKDIQNKKILPFIQVLEKARRLIKGEIIETEFDIEDGQPVYEFKFITEKGRVREIYINGRTGGLFKKEQY